MIGRRLSNKQRAQRLLAGKPISGFAAPSCPRSGSRPGFRIRASYHNVFLSLKSGWSAKVQTSNVRANRWPQFSFAACSGVVALEWVMATGGRHHRTADWRRVEHDAPRAELRELELEGPHEGVRERVTIVMCVTARERNPVLAGKVAQQKTFPSSDDKGENGERMDRARWDSASDRGSRPRGLWNCPTICHPDSVWRALCGHETCCIWHLEYRNYSRSFLPIF